MRKILLFFCVAFCSVTLAELSNVYALPAFYKMFRAKYQWAGGCNVCHFSKKGGDTQNSYGKTFMNNGMNAATFARIEAMDSDKDGFSNIVEIRARSYPGEPEDIPKEDSPLQQTEEEEEEEDDDDDDDDDDSIFNFELEEDTGEGLDSPGLLGSALDSLTFGGALDIRRIVRGKDLAPDSEKWGTGTTLIHVAEFVLTTNVGDNVTILGEQLLTTSPLGTSVADDHGFVYAILTGLPVLPKGASLKIGRFRHQFGIDTKSDAATNPLYNIVRKNIGFITDRGMQLNGYAGPISYVVSIADGPDSLRTVTEGTVESGIRIGPHGSGGGVLKPINNNSPPIFIHLTGNLPILGKRFWIGTSYFDGNSFPFNPNTGDVNPSTLVYKRRVGIATSFKLWKLNIAGEWTRGNDTLLMKYTQNASKIPKRDFTVQGYYLHAELPLTETVDIRVKYDILNPDTAAASTFFNQEKDSPVWTTLGAALTWHFTEGGSTRLVYQIDNVEKSTRKGRIIPQILVEF